MGSSVRDLRLERITADPTCVVYFQRDGTVAQTLDAAAGYFSENLAVPPKLTKNCEFTKKTVNSLKLATTNMANHYVFQLFARGIGIAIFSCENAMEAVAEERIEVAGSWHEAHETVARLEAPPAGYFWAVTTRRGDNDPKIIYLARLEC